MSFTSIEIRRQISTSLGTKDVLECVVGFGANSIDCAMS